MTAGDLARRIARLGRGERLTVMGVGRDGIGAILSAEADRSRSVLLVACDGLATVGALRDQLLQDLAVLALDCWPRWHGETRLGAAETAPAADTITGDPWLKAAAKRARAGQPPRFRRLAPELELVRLLRAIDPAGVVLIWDIDPASAARAGPVIEALEWCARHGAAVVGALTVPPQGAAPYDRVLYGACELAHFEPAATERFLTSVSGVHHASAIEARVAAALARDSDLEGLFLCNMAVPVGEWGAKPRVDLLCPAHRIVIELDGPEHRAEPKFSADRHRDYELLIAGYLVLRLTNEQVDADLPLAIEKIRAVVRLRCATKEG